MSKRKVVALLPMKANSERVKGKNFRTFVNKPLFKWILDSLLAVDEVSQVVINTDAREILAENGLIESDRIVIRDRKKDLCGDFVSMNKILLDDINFRDLFKMFDPSFLSRTSLIKGKGIEEFLKGKIPASTFEELHIPMKIVATDFWRRNDIVYDSGELIPAIRASMSIPALFKPVVFENRVLTDGGASNILPIDLIRENCDLLIAIDVSGSLRMCLSFGDFACIWVIICCGSYFFFWGYFWGNRGYFGSSWLYGLLWLWYPYCGGCFNYIRVFGVHLGDFI